MGDPGYQGMANVSTNVDPLPELEGFQICRRCIEYCFVHRCDDRGVPFSLLAIEWLTSWSRLIWNHPRCHCLGSHAFTVRETRSHCRPVCAFLD